MAAMYSHVFSPIRLGPVEVRNRLVRSANATNLTKGGVGPELIEYTRIRARAGVGLFINGNACVQRRISHSPFRVHDDACIDDFRRLMDAVAPHGARMFQQLWHPGHNVPPPDGSPPLSASDVPGPRLGIVPLPLTKPQINEIVESFAEAASRCEKGGLDGVEVHGAHGYLFQQFLSPRTNRREDEYGGSAENRMRFTLDVLSAIRRAVSSRFALGIKLSPQAYPGGLTGADYVPVIRKIAERGLADFIDLSMGSYFAMDKILGPMHEPPGYQLSANQPILETATIPRIVNGRFGTLAEAEEVLAAGSADMVAMTRALIADGMLIEKFRNGDDADVRPCIACNEGCIGGLAVDQMSCSVNPAVLTPYEAELPKTSVRRRVLIVGGGPAGMEAARVAAIRGHDVTIVEAEERLGGTVQIARRAPKRERLGEFVDWQERQVRGLGVDIRVGTRFDGTAIAAAKPEVLILATGSRPRKDGIQYRQPARTVSGVQLAHVHTSHDIFDLDLAPHSRAVVVDDTGHFEAADVAEYLLARRLTVSFVTAFDQFAPLLQPLMAASSTLCRLRGGGAFSLHPLTIVDRIETGAVHGHVFGTDIAIVLPADLVVLISPNRPQRDCVDLLGWRPKSLHVIGDANSPRFLGTAVREGFAAGLQA